MLATTVTDANGNYSFGALDIGSYQVWVDTLTLPEGLTNGVDPDAPAGDSIHRHPEGTTLVNLDQDFGYTPAGGVDNPAGSIGDRIWDDRDANGVYEPGNGEPGIDGVTVALYEDVNGDGKVDSGDRLVGNTVTASDGAYSFANLPTSPSGVDYLVKVTDDDGLLTGWWHSTGPDAGGGLTDDNSQVDPYPVTLTSTATDNATADFGYYVAAAALGNRVWVDINENGIQDSGEPGLGGVEVTLTIAYPSGAGTSTLVTTSAADGSYDFGNLLLDENFNGQTGSEPTYTISVATPTGYTPTTIGALGSTSKDDSNDPAGSIALPIQGETDVALNTSDPYDPNAETDSASYDFGYIVDGNALDFGDLPTSADTGFGNDYPTTLADDGARHVINGTFLGSQRHRRRGRRPADGGGRRRQHRRHRRREGRQLPGEPGGRPDQCRRSPWSAPAPACSTPGSTSTRTASSSPVSRCSAMSR